MDIEGDFVVDKKHPLLVVLLEALPPGAFLLSRLLPSVKSDAAGALPALLVESGRVIFLREGLMFTHWEPLL